MPHVYAIAVLKNSSRGLDDEAPADSVFLEQEFELSEFNFFLRGKAREMITFLIRVVVQRTEGGSKNIVEEGDYRCHASVNLDGLACAVVTDKDYPARVAFSLSSLILMEFVTVHGEKWRRETADVQYKTPAVEKLLIKYQQPDEADKMNKIQKEIEEVKDIMHQNIESLLDRGQKLDDVIARSEDLSEQSKGFLYQAKEQNSCRRNCTG